MQHLMFLQIIPWTATSWFDRPPLKFEQPHVQSKSSYQAGKECGKMVAVVRLRRGCGGETDAIQPVNFLVRRELMAASFLSLSPSEN
jgi:hypothetical protein